MSEAFHADELWHQMLAACPSEHYELLHLKRQGATIAEIAASTGLHEGACGEFSIRSPARSHGCAPREATAAADVRAPTMTSPLRPVEPRALGSRVDLAVFVFCFVAPR